MTINNLNSVLVDYLAFHKTVFIHKIYGLVILIQANPSEEFLCIRQGRLEGTMQYPSLLLGYDRFISKDSLAFAMPRIFFVRH